MDRARTTTTAPGAPAPQAEQGGRPRLASSVAVAGGIFLSRAAGLVRQSVIAHFLGSSDAADVFAAGFRIPNLLQNLFGEGALSASFIPIYARLRAEGHDEEATRVARVVAGILALTISVLVVLGIVLTPFLIDLIAPGFVGEKRAATIRLVQIFFPGAGLLVMSAWSLGVLNSHRRFFLSYAAPVAWNACIVAAMLVFAPRAAGYRLAEYVAWGSVVGSGLQLLVQIPTVLALLGTIRPSLAWASGHAADILRNFVPVAVGRGVVQVSAYVDQIIASFLPTGAIAALSYGQILYTLPVSLFGMAVSASELPKLSSLVGARDVVEAQIRGRLDAGLANIAFFVVPSAAAFLALGDVVAALLFQHGLFTGEDARLVWKILAGSSVGLLAATMARLYSSAFYALRDARTPLRFAIVRVTLTAGLGYLCAIPLPRALGVDALWGTAGLTVSAGIAGWVEFWLLRRQLNRRIGGSGLHPGFLVRLWLAALLAVSAGWVVKLALRPGPGRMQVVSSASVLATYGLVYVGAAYALRVQHARLLVGRLLRRPARV